jgi:hypothetical protein
MHSRKSARLDVDAASASTRRPTASHPSQYETMLAVSSRPSFGVEDVLIGSNRA